VFPLKNKLLRMVEWGVVQAKFQNSKMQIEEKMLDGDVKIVLPKVWVQFTGLPSHLHDYLVIWVVGSMLGVTKDVDMAFTRRFDICRMQVLVMDPNLIPSSVNVVIGENLYELKFRVELSVEASNPQPMETDHNGDEGADPRGDAEGGSGNQGPKSDPRSGAGGTQSAGHKMLGSAPEARVQGSGHKKAVFVLKFQHGPVPVTTANGSQLAPEESADGLHVGSAGKWAEGGAENVGAAFESLGQEASGGFSKVEKGMVLSREEAMSSAELARAAEETGDEEEVTKEDDWKAPGVEQLAAIPEASLDMSSARTSKRRAEDVDQFLGFSAEHRKAIRNEGMLPDFHPVSFAPDSVIVSNMESIGVSLGQDLDSVMLSISILKNLASVNHVENKLG
jgi:hypothetical protein